MSVKKIRRCRDATPTNAQQSILGHWWCFIPSFHNPFPSCSSLFGLTVYLHTMLMWRARVLQCWLVAFVFVALAEAASGARQGRLPPRSTTRKSVRTTQKKIAQAWYTGWHATEGFPLSSVSWDKYTHLTYAFAYDLQVITMIYASLHAELWNFRITTPSVKNISLSGSDPSLLPKFVEKAHKHVYRVC
jgi:hypothetical protein